MKTMLSNCLSVKKYRKLRSKSFKNWQWKSNAFIKMCSV